MSGEAYKNCIDIDDNEIMVTVAAKSSNVLAGIETGRFSAKGDDYVTLDTDGDPHEGEMNRVAAAFLLLAIKQDCIEAMYELAKTDDDHVRQTILAMIGDPDALVEPRA